MANFNKVKCELCGKMIATCGIQNHFKFHENEKKRQEEREARKLKRADRDDLFCKYCGKQCKNLNSLMNHEIRCSNNPDRISSTGEALVKYNKEHHSTRGKKYSDFDKWKSTEKLVCQYCGRDSTSTCEPFSSLYGLMRHEQACRYNPVNAEVRPDHVSSLEQELDDDGKLFNKYSMKRSNAKTMGNEFHLTLHEFCTLIKEAGLVSSQLGLNGLSYELARYGDTGPYEIGNCRFITHQENMQECETSKAKLSAIGKSGVGQAAAKRDREENPEKYRQMYENRKINSEYFQRRKLEAEKRELERRENLDVRYTGEHNSQFEKHWITNGTENRMWDPEEEMPEGFHLGRVNCNQYSKST